MRCARPRACRQHTIPLVHSLAQLLSSRDFTEQQECDRRRRVRLGRAAIQGMLAHTTHGKRFGRAFRQWCVVQKLQFGTSAAVATR